MPGLIEMLERRSIPEPTTGCWLWLGALTKGGYANLFWDGKYRAGHRLAWQARSGRPPKEGAVVRHRCDQRACVNPDHVVEGTQLENMRDMKERGRAVMGEAHPSAKMTDEQVAAIRVDGRTQVVIAAEYNISQAQVSRIKSGANRAPA